MNRSTNSICNSADTTIGGQARSRILVIGITRTGELDDQTLVRTALQTKAAAAVEIADFDRVKNQVSDIGVVKHCLGCDRSTADF